MPGDEASYQEKVRSTFDELDLKRGRGFGLDEWITVLQRLHIDFNLATMRDVFDKADANHDGTITFSEYQKFCEVYPTLLDSLYYRSQDYWTDVHQTKALEAARQQERALLDREEQCRMDCLEAQQQTDQQDHRLQMQLQRHAEAQSREEEARDMVRRSHEITTVCRLEVRDRAADHAEARENERAIQAGLNEARRAVEIAAQLARDSDHEVLKAEEYLREIERQLMEQRAVVETLMINSEKCRKDLSLSQSTEQTAVTALSESQRAVQLSGERLSLSETELEESIAREREANDVAAAAAAEVARMHAQKDAETQELSRLKEREALAKQAEEEAGGVYREHQRALQGMEAQNHDFNAQRSEVEREEAPLLEQEVILREQRESLEDREAKLRTNSSLFSTSRRSPSPSSYRARLPTSPVHGAPHDFYQGRLGGGDRSVLSGRSPRPGAFDEPPTSLRSMMHSSRGRSPRRARV